MCPIPFRRYSTSTTIGCSRGWFYMRIICKCCTIQFFIVITSSVNKPHALEPKAWLQYAPGIQSSIKSQGQRSPIDVQGQGMWLSNTFGQFCSFQLLWFPGFFLPRRLFNVSGTQLRDQSIVGCPYHKAKPLCVNEGIMLNSIVYSVRSSTGSSKTWKAIETQYQNLDLWDFFQAWLDVWFPMFCKCRWALECNSVARLSSHKDTRLPY